MSIDNHQANSQHLEFIERLLCDLGAGRLSPAETAQQLYAAMGCDDAGSTTAEIEEAQVDIDRQSRCGFPEVVYGEGKSVSAVVGVLETLANRGVAGLATRVSAEQAAVVLARFPSAIYNSVGRTVRLAGSPEKPPVGKVVVVTAGTSDRPIAEEAIETLRWMGCGADLIVDIGVAGPKRLLQQKHRFDDADAVVVLAGMEGALPSVVGGWVACPVIAVPTSVGYGASFGGIAALLGMLNSCASNVSVVNIDAGFKGAYVAGMIVQRVHRSCR